jgi:hypothetical protein
MGKLQLALVAILSIVTSGCIQDSDAEPNNSVDFSTVSNGRQTGLSGQQMLVLSTNDQFALMMSQTTLNGTIPNVDFTSEMMVALFIDTDSACDGMRVDGIEDNGTSIIIKATKTIPGPNTVCVAVVPPDDPYVMVTIPKSKKVVSLLVEETAI